MRADGNCARELRVDAWSGEVGAGGRLLEDAKAARQRRRQGGEHFTEHSLEPACAFTPVGGGSAVTGLVDL